MFPPFYVFLRPIIYANFPEYDKKIDEFAILSNLRRIPYGKGAQPSLKKSLGKAGKESREAEASVSKRQRRRENSQKNLPDNEFA